MGKKYCSVKNCKNTSEDRGIVLHIIKNEWKNVVDWKTETPYRICSAHFIESNYLTDGKNLTYDAKPSRCITVNKSHVLHDHAYALPTADILAERLKKSEEENRSVKRELKKCKAEKRKLEDEIDGLDSVLRECKRKFNISQTSVEALEALSSSIPKELFDRAAKKMKFGSNPPYSRALKKFASTLHFHSPAAYR